MILARLDYTIARKAVMGVEFKVACNDCHDYLELHKWCPDPAMAGIHPA